VSKIKYKIKSRYKVVREKLRAKLKATQWSKCEVKIEFNSFKLSQFISNNFQTIKKEGQNIK